MQNREHGDRVSYLNPGRDCLYLSVLINPRAKRSEIRGTHGNRLRIAIAAPPVDGAANDALVKFVAKVLKVSRSSVSVARGEGSREKTLAITGLSYEGAIGLLKEFEGE